VQIEQMPKFHIIHEEMDLYRNEILEFWQKYLPETPPRRFEWLYNGNPAGKTIWFLAINKDNHDLAGTISIMPKELLVDGRTIRAGILGDFMVGSKYRVFGPALSLLKKAITSVKDLGLEFIYTIPNNASKKLLERAGFLGIDSLYYLVRPINVQHHIKKYANSLVGKIIAPFIGLYINIFSRELFTSDKGVFEEVNIANELFDILWDKIKIQQSGIKGDHGLNYINWRYFQNPLYKFKFLIYKKLENTPLLGYIVYTIYDNKLEIFNITSTNKDSTERLLKRLVSIAYREQCDGIYLTISKNNIWFNTLKAHLFFDTKYDMRLYSFGNKDVLTKDWHFFGCDRNI
jgi:hypothetical protein